MTIWKKAISVATSAALLASLLATAVAPGAFAAVTNYGVLVPFSTTVTTVPADGLSYIDLTFAAATGEATGGTVGITTTAGTFTTGTGAFLPGATMVYPKTSVQVPGAANAGVLRLTSPLAAGSATVTVAYTVAGVAKTDSVTAFTFTATTGTSVSTAFSWTELNPAKTATAVGGDTGVKATTYVRDTNNVAVTAGATVTWTLTGPAYFAGTLTATSLATPVILPDGSVTSPAIYSTGAAGPVTVATSVKFLNVAYPLANVTLTLVGAPAKVVGTAAKQSLGAAPSVKALFVQVTDAAGQSIRNNVVFTVGAYTPQNIYTITFPGPAPAADAFYNTTDKGYYFDVSCVDVGTATVTIKATVGTTTVTSEAVTFTCATPLDAAHLGTLEVSAGASTVAANSSVPILVTVKDVNGLPAPDGFEINAVTNGVGTVVNAAGTLPAKTTNGVAKLTFFAPANAGSATITVFATNTVPTTKSVTIAIGPTGSGVAVGQVESALGVTTTGPWSKSTKVAKVGEFITFKINAGSANAGKTVGIFIQTKDANGVWSAPVRFTARVADSKGIAFFNWRGTKAMWISLKGGMGDVGQSNPIQARWQ